jgi:NADH-quinone oxidoreductase subunit M
MLMGEVKNEEHYKLTDATWYEKTGIFLLLIPITAMGMAPLWLSDMITESLAPFIARML